MKFDFIITEYLKKIVRVEAEDYKEACRKVNDLCCEEIIVLTADDFCDRDIVGLADLQDYVDLDFTQEG